MGNNRLKLIPLDIETAELVRVWRNSTSINQFMDFQEQITFEQQITWFNSLKCSGNFYFSINFDHQPIGMTHLDRICKKSNSAYAGLFIGDNSYQGTGTSVYASLLLLDFGFNKLKLDCIYAKVKRTNTVAINYNKSIGFKFDKIESTDFDRYVISKEVYEGIRLKILPLLSL